MVRFFAKYPIITYNNGDVMEAGISARDILQRAKVRDFLVNNYLIFYDYTIKDGQTPEIIANNLYGSPQYHWIVLLVNNIIDPYYDWPMTTENLIATIQTKYGSNAVDGLTFARTTVHHYEDNFGNPIDLTTYNALPDTQRTTIHIYDWEVSQNEAKRNIRLLDKRFVDQIDAEMDEIMKSPVA